MAALSSRSQELTGISSAPDFWTLSEPEEREKILRELSEVNSTLENFKHINSEYEDLSAIEEILRDTEDPELEAEFSQRASALRTELERSSLLLLLNEPYDSSNAILMIHAGSGGLDSQDWAGMLLRMYLRYCEREGFKTNVIEATTDEGEGIKNATVMIEGHQVFQQ